MNERTVSKTELKYEFVSVSSALLAQSNKV
jgi:hypothetical protein